MTCSDSGTTVYIGNLKSGARILELKASLQNLLTKTLKITNITSNDISIVNGLKRYAIVDVHNEHHMEYILQMLGDPDERKKLKFKFELLEEQGSFLHVDMVKSQDDKQTQEDYVNAPNAQHPFKRPHRHIRKRPDYGVALAIKSVPTRSRTEVAESRSSRHSRSTQPIQPPSPEFYTSTDLDVTLDELLMDRSKAQSQSFNNEMGEAINKPISMIPLDDSTLKVFVYPYILKKYSLR